MATMAIMIAGAKRKVALGGVMVALALLTTSLGLDGARPVAAQAAPAPDLTVSITKNPTGSIFTGQKVTYTVTTRNIGNLGAAPVLTTVTINGAAQIAITQPAFQPACTLAGPIAKSTLTCDNQVLAAGGSSTVKLDLTAPNAAGTISATATVDPNNVIAESNEGNNTASASTAVLARPDLTVVDGIDCPEQVTGSFASFTCTVVVSNIGPGGTPVGTGIDLLIETPNLPVSVTAVNFIGADDGFACEIHNPFLVFGSASVECHGGHLFAGDSATIELTLKTPLLLAGFPNGQLTVRVDPNDTIVETTNLNNFESVTVPVAP